MPSKRANTADRPLPPLTTEYRIERYEVSEVIEASLKLADESPTVAIRVLNGEDGAKVTLSPKDAEALIPVLERLISAGQGHGAWYSEKEIEEMYRPPTPSPRKKQRAKVTRRAADSLST